MDTMSADPLPQPSGGSTFTGITLSLLVAFSSIAINLLIPILSPLLLAIVAGAVLVNLGVLPTSAQPGLDFSAKHLLRAGIVLLGLQLSLQDIAGLGAGMIVVVVVIVTVGLLATLWIGSLLGLSWTQRLLIACGFSICGAAAVAAADAVVEAEEEEVASSIALVVVFGTAMIAVIPILANLLGLDDHTAGLWAGGSIHEVAQVVAAAGAIGGGALGVAVIVKLARVLMLAPIMAALSIWQRNRSTSTTSPGARPPLIPLFVLGFLAMVVITSTFALPSEVTTPVRYLQTGLLSAAMFALGCGVRRDALKAVGVKPVALAGAATGVVMVVSLVGVLLVG